MNLKKHEIKASTLLILLCWLVYACSYMGKVNYAANINQVMIFYQVDHSSAGLVSTFFFFAYGVGQVINGLFCKKYNLKWMIFSSLLLSGLVNLIVGITNNFVVIKFLWLLNGFAMSILWPSLIRLLSESLDKSTMPKASMIMGTTIATGTFLVYLLSALFVKINFKLSFYLPASIFFTVALVWLFTYSGLVSRVKNENKEEDSQVSNIVDKNDVNYNKMLILLSICTLALYGIATNLIKDGLTTWVPSILKEQYALDGSISIVLTLALPIVSIFANAFAIKVHSKIFDFVLQCAIMFLLAGLIIGGVIAGIALNQFIITLIGFAAVCFLVSSCNSVITSIFPLFMKGRVNSGLIAGILNGFCYLGSTISSYGLGAIADHFGWTVVFWVLLGVCVFICSIAVIYLFVRKKIRVEVSV
ncbi:MAG: MFS transporter [Clostridia bacterium]|nr:MFS transporter [Clostridia bacterium]